MLFWLAQNEEHVVNIDHQVPMFKNSLQGFLKVLVVVIVVWLSTPAMSNTAVQLHVQDDQVVIDNGIFQLTLSNPGGIVTGIRYGGIDNLIELRNKDLNGGYLRPCSGILIGANQEVKEQGESSIRMIEGTSFTVIVENEEQVELSFTRIWVPSLQGKQAPLKIDKRFVVLRGCSGFYSYAIFEHLEDMPAFIINTTRIAFMLNKDKFHYMAVADNRQRFMPDPEDRLPNRSQVLAYPEAVLLVDPLEPEFQGEVDDKYQYSCEDKDNRVHGWISFDPPVGFWQITPSNEFRTGGPFKQDLTSHVNPTTLAIFVTPHYAGADLVVKFEAGEIWKKVYGPVFIHLNSVPDKNEGLSLWDNAKEQMNIQVQSWPYNFPASEDFPLSNQRGILSGRLLVQDRYISKQNMPAKGAFVGLAAPGDVGSWQRECKGYQFWTRTDEAGYFTIKGIRAGDYNLYASVPGFIGDYRYDVAIKVAAGSVIETGDLVYGPPRDGPTLWEIGVPNRSAAEFYIPDPNPMYINKLYVNHPDRKIGEKTYKGTTWQIKFKLGTMDQNGTYKLRLALASAQNSELQVRVNDAEANPPLFSTGEIGKDNAIARHGIHGLYWLFNVEVPSALLMQGDDKINTIYLTQTRHTSPFQGIMYDYIRLEGPSAST
ncbi:hypothetical protein RHMOL_Rhmol06G0088100 [Rhododendron molle]|uniref:Uncharacterized protein n=1 Tax=Rhododendron molle TaxID=49168 RepID=A0ACC0NAW4_RHOML|nr:hypothetical protein RHMOL_Rhmol06G0088100 [Rhododendron molle]